MSTRAGVHAASAFICLGKQVSKRRLHLHGHVVEPVADVLDHMQIEDFEVVVARGLLLDGLDVVPVCV